MQFRPIALALLLSAVAGAVVAATIIPPASLFEAGTLVPVAQQWKDVDCHRDVRVHRIHGVVIRHRHVGKNCAVREVRMLNSF